MKKNEGLLDGQEVISRIYHKMRKGKVQKNLHYVTFHLKKMGKWEVNEIC